MLLFRDKITVFLMLALLLLSHQGVLAQMQEQKEEQEQEIVLEGASCTLIKKAKVSCDVAPDQFSQNFLLEALPSEKEGFPVLKTLLGLEKFRRRGEKFRKNVEQARFAAVQRRIRLGQSVKDKVYIAKMKSYRKGLKQYKAYCAHYKQSLHAFLKKNPKLKPVQPRPALTLVQRRQRTNKASETFPFFPDS